MVREDERGIKGKEDFKVRNSARAYSESASADVPLGNRLCVRANAPGCNTRSHRLLLGSGHHHQEVRLREGLYWGKARGVG